MIGDVVLTDRLAVGCAFCGGGLEVTVRRHPGSGWYVAEVECGACGVRVRDGVQHEEAEDAAVSLGTKCARRAHGWGWVDV